MQMAEKLLTITSREILQKLSDHYMHAVDGKLKECHPTLLHDDGVTLPSKNDHCLQMGREAIVQ